MVPSHPNDKSIPLVNWYIGILVHEGKSLPNDKSTDAPFPDTSDPSNPNTDNTGFRETKVTTQNFASLRVFQNEGSLFLLTHQKIGKTRYIPIPTTNPTIGKPVHWYIGKSWYQPIPTTNPYHW
jgi:hypothetical protein